MEKTMKTPVIFLVLDVLMVLGYGGVLFLNFFRRIFRRTKV
jgi:hypothetical protein